MEYLVDGIKYSYSYTELKEDYHEISRMSDVDFMSDIPRILHFVCIVSFIKETPSSVLLSDEGLIHLLVHLLNEETRTDPIMEDRIADIREKFDILCKLA